MSLLMRSFLRVLVDIPGRIMYAIFSGSGVPEAALVLSRQILLRINLEY